MGSLWKVFCEFLIRKTLGLQAWESDIISSTLVACYLFVIPKIESYKERALVSFALTAVAETPSFFGFIFGNTCRSINVGFVRFR